MICLTAFFLFPGQQDLNLELIVELTLVSKWQIDGEDFINVCGLLGKHELYNTSTWTLSCGLLLPMGLVITRLVSTTNNVFIMYKIGKYVVVLALLTY